MSTKCDYGTSGWQQYNWEQQRTWLRARIKTGDIRQATREELENYLVHLAAEPDNVKYDVEAETKRFASLVQQLLTTATTTMNTTSLNSVAVFISHSGKDEKLAEALVELLRNALSIPANAIRCTSVNGYRLPAGAPTDEALRREVHESKAFIGLITPSSMESAYVMFELGARWGATLHLVPLLGAGADRSYLRGPLGALNALNCEDVAQVHQLVDDLGRLLNIDERTPTAAYQAYVDRLIVASKAVQRPIVATTPRRDPELQVQVPQLSGEETQLMIHHAANAGDLGKVKVLLKGNPDSVFSKDSNGRTPLHTAAAKGYKAVAELLLANKAEANAKDNSGSTPLHEAVLCGSKAVVELLLANKAKVNAGAEKGQTPLHIAACKDHEGVVELLVANKAEVNAKDQNDSTPLHEATFYGHKAVVELLLANKAKVNAKSKSGETPLHGAADNGHKDVAELLLANKAEVNARAEKGQTPLHTAATKGYKAVAQLLLANKAEVNAKDKNSKTPLHYAATNDKKDMLELLLVHHADANAKDKYGMTPSHYAATNDKNDMLELLSQYGE